MGADVTQIHSGIQGLDEILRGGFGTGRMYLVRGRPGTGKTILGVHFLTAGLERDETVLYIHGEESREEILFNASQFGIDLSEAAFLDLGPESDFFTEGRPYDLVDPSELERDQFLQEIHAAIEDIDPERIVFDPITQLRYVESSEYQFRKRILSLMRFLKQRGTTVVATATISGAREYSTEVQSMSDGVIELTGDGRQRRIRVVKHRGFGQQDGDHGLAIRDEGLEVFPSLVPDSGERTFDDGYLRSGVDELDALVGGGLETGTVTFLNGPTGIGKTTVGTQFLVAAAEADLPAAAYLFEESPETFTHRAESVGQPVEALRERGTLRIEEVDPLVHSAEEFAHRVSRHVNRDDVGVVLIDGLDGYMLSVQGDESALVRKLHALTRELKRQDVTVIVTNETGAIPDGTTPGRNLGHLADVILSATHVERDGQLRKAIGALKKRTGEFESTFREFAITSEGLRIGDPLSDVTDVLAGGGR